MNRMLRIKLKINSQKSLWALLIAFSNFFFVLVNGQPTDASKGKLLFQNNCASCHAINKQVTGPALRDVDQRHSEEWIIAFVHASQTVIKSGDTSAVRLFNQYNKVIMPNHPRLSSFDIKNIIAYIKEESKMPLPSPTTSATSAMQEYKPYKENHNLIHNIVYLDFQFVHSPMSLNQPWVWICIAFCIFIFVLLLNITTHISDLQIEETTNEN